MPFHKDSRLSDGRNKPNFDKLIYFELLIVIKEENSYKENFIKDLEEKDMNKWIKESNIDIYHINDEKLYSKNGINFKIINKTLNSYQRKKYMKNEFKERQELILAFQQKTSSLNMQNQLSSIMNNNFQKIGKRKDNNNSIAHKEINDNIQNSTEKNTMKVTNLNLELAYKNEKVDYFNKINENSNNNQANNSNMNNIMNNNMINNNLNDNMNFNMNNNNKNDININNINLDCTLKQINDEGKKSITINKKNNNIDYNNVNINNNLNLNNNINNNNLFKNNETIKILNINNINIERKTIMNGKNYMNNENRNINNNINNEYMSNNNNMDNNSMNNGDVNTNMTQNNNQCNNNMNNSKMNDNNPNNNNINNNDMNNNNMNSSNMTNYNININMNNNKINKLENYIKELELKLKEKDSIIKEEKEKNNILNKKIEELENKSNKNYEIKNTLDLENEIKLFRKYCNFNENDKLISIKFISGDQDVNFSIIAKNNDKFSFFENKLYEKYPKYTDSENYFLVNGNIIKRHKSLEENNIKNNDIITLQINNLE